MPSVPRRSAAIRLRLSKKRTERIVAVELAIAMSGVCAGAHARTSGATHVTAGPSTTWIRPDANAVFGRSSSPSVSPFFDSWKSAAEAARTGWPAFSFGACGCSTRARASIRTRS